MITVLVTGRMGSGKSQTLDFVKSNEGCAVFKADQFAKSLLAPKSPCFKALIRLMGSSFLTKDSLFDKKLLAQELFRNIDKLKKVEKIIHPLVQKEFENFIKQSQTNGQKIIFYEMPLISQEAFQNRFDHVILVQCPEDVSLKRLKKKGFKEEEIYLRWQAQIKEESILGLADFVILNNGTSESLEQQIKKILIDLKKEKDF